MIPAPGTQPHAKIVHIGKAETNLLEALHHRMIFGRQCLVQSLIKGNPFSSGNPLTAEKLFHALTNVESSDAVNLEKAVASGVKVASKAASETASKS